MNPWDELFQGQVADEFSGMLAADFSSSLQNAGEEKENTGYTCGRTCSCGPEACGKEPEEGKTEYCDPAGGSIHYTACRTCAKGPDGCVEEKKTSSGDEFSPRVPGWSTPPEPRASL